MDAPSVLATVCGRFADGAPEFANGFAEHAPMGAEAMLALGIDPAAVLAWSERHRPEPLAPDSPVAVAREAVESELAGADWRDVVRRHLAELTDRLDSHLFHGLIRTAHAVRAITLTDDDRVRRELAAGLAAWRTWAGTAPSADPLVSEGDPLAAILDAARRGAAAYVAAPSIFTLHAVTGPMAFLLVADHADERTRAVAAAAFARTHRRHPPAGGTAGQHRRPSDTELATLTTRWDAHPAKLVEAALRGHHLTGDAVFLEAAATMMS